ncbi:MAG: DciA family protein [Planctomycetota bacterium]|jgi:hypothetical protein
MHSFADALKGALADAGIDKRVSQEALQVRWAEALAAAGAEAFASATRVQGYRAGVLTVEVESAPVLQELVTFHKGQLEERVRRSGPPLTKLSAIRFRLGTF